MLDQKPAARAEPALRQTKFTPREAAGEALVKQLHGANVLVTGGTGSFGKAFVQRILTDYPDISRLIIYSRDELKQYEFQQEFPRDQFPNLRLVFRKRSNGHIVWRLFQGLEKP